MKQKSKTIFYKAVIALSAVAAFVWLGSVLAGNTRAVALVEHFGYGGIFTVSLVSGFNLLFPIPIATFIPLFFAAGYPALLTIVVIALGMTAGDSISYLLGILGRKLFIEKTIEKTKENDPTPATAPDKIFKTLKHFQRRHQTLPFVALFGYVAFVPAPNELIVIPMALLGYSYRAMVFFIFIGNIIFNGIVGLSLLGLFG